MNLNLFINIYQTLFWVNSGILNFETCNIPLFQITVSFWWLSNVVMQAKSTLWLDYYSSECGAQECLIVHNRLHCLSSTASCCCCPLFLFWGCIWNCVTSKNYRLHMGENKKGLVIIVRVKMHFKHTEGEVKEVGWEKRVHILSIWPQQKLHLWIDFSTNCPTFRLLA